MNIDTSTYKKFYRSLKKYYDKEVLPNRVIGPKEHYVFNFGDPNNNYYIEATSREELNYILLFKMDNGSFCQELYDYSELIESGEKIESIEEINIEIDLLLEKELFYNLKGITFLKI